MAAVEENDEFTTSVGGLLVDDQGRIDSIVVMSDGENYYSRLTRINDIGIEVAQEKVIEQYGGNFWFTDIGRTANGSFFLPDANGCVHTDLNGAWHIEEVCSGSALRCIWITPEGDIYVAGTSGIVYQRKSEGWQAISPPLGNWITAIGGPTHTNLLVAGDNGLVWRFDGTEWVRIDLGTNVNLTGILWRAPKHFMICGGRGTLFQGSGDDWENISRGGVDLFKMVLYRGEIWIALGSSGVGRLTDDDIATMRDTFAAFRIHVAGSYLAAAGNHIVARFDDTTWRGYGYR